MDLQRGTPIAVIRSKNNKKLKNRLVYVNEDEIDNPERSEMRFPNKDTKLEVLPIVSNEKQNTRLFVSGPSGSGKSTFVRDFLRNYQKLFKGKPIYYISRLTNDPAFKDMKDMIYINAQDNDILDLTPEMFGKSLVIFDDFECLSDKAILKHLYFLRNTLLEIGRHQYSDIIIVSHQILNNHVSKIVHLESNLVCVFPKSNFAPIQNYIKRYLGVTDKDMLQKIRKLPSRWVMFRRSYPVVAVHEKGAFLL